ncbi:MAG TPA: hypothetical protein PK644_02310, partial [bacterium]|nr:hypothetical protein [bacterium]
MKRIHEILGGGLAGRAAGLAVPVAGEMKEAEASAEEMRSLARTAGVRILNTFLFRLHQINPATYV